MSKGKETNNGYCVAWRPAPEGSDIAWPEPRCLLGSEVDKPVLTCSVERKTGFEPTTLTLAR